MLGKLEAGSLGTRHPGKLRRGAHLVSPGWSCVTNKADKTGKLAVTGHALADLSPWLQGCCLGSRAGYCIGGG